MPYVNIRLTSEGVTAQQKQVLVRGVTDLLVEVLDKDPRLTHVVIDEVDTENWGFDGQTVSHYRQQR